MVLDESLDWRGLLRQMSFTWLRISDRNNLNKGFWLSGKKDDVFWT